jgi:hypothetical protein
MSDESLQARLESQAKSLPLATAPEKRGFRSEDQFLAANPPPDVPPPNVIGLDFSKPEPPAICPVCGEQLPADAILKAIDGGMFLCCRKCNPKST